MPVPPYVSSKRSSKISCSRKSSTTSHGNSCDASISAARGAMRSGERSHELADLELVVGERLPGHDRSLGGAHTGFWQTASMLFPSASWTNAP